MNWHWTWALTRLQVALRVFSLRLRESSRYRNEADMAEIYE